MKLFFRAARLGAACAAMMIIGGCAGISVPYPAGSMQQSKEPTVTVISPKLVLGLKEDQAQTAPGDQPGLPAGGTTSYRYEIRANDVLRISVPSVVIFNTPGDVRTNGSTEAADSFVVYDDGTVYLPFGGPVEVAGLTPAEAQARIVNSLSRYLRTGQVAVSMAAFRSQRVLVTGQVQKPGYQSVTDVPLTLVGAISEAGGIAQLRGRVDPRAVTTAASQMTQTGPEYPDLRHVLLKRGTDSFVVNVEDMLRTGDVRQDFVLKDGDVLIVPPLKRANVFVLGEVIRPSLVEVSSGEADLAKVLVAAGGINQLTANARRVYVVRGDYVTPTIYQLDSRHPDALLLAQQFPILANDIIYVAEAPIGRWNRALSQILPTLQGLLSTAVIVNTVDNLNNK